MFPLRLYQESAIQRVKALIREGVQSICLVSPTGSGKTVIAAHMLLGVIRKSNRALFLAHRKELIDQCSGKLTDLEIPHGIIMAGYREDPTAPVQVASVQTLVRRKFPKQPDFIITDEAHHASASSYQKIYDAYPEAIHIGLTATPFRSDGRGLGDVFKAAVPVITVPQLIDQGFLARPKYWAPSQFDLSGIGLSKGDWDQEAVAEKARQTSLIGDMIRHYRELSAGQRAILFAPTVKFSCEIADRFIAAGIPAAHLDDATPGKQRTQILADLMRGKILVVSNVGILTEGFDSPAVVSAIFARPTMSRGLFLQMGGRVLRPFPGKDCAKIIDHVGNVRRHGFLTDPIEADLSSGLRKKSDNVAPALRTCERCYAIFSANVSACPLCGYVATAKNVRTIVESDGTLKELTTPECKACGSFEVERRPHEIHGTGVWCAQCGRHLRWLGKQITPEEFYQKQFRLCVEKGWKPGRAGIIFKKRYGYWPGTDITEKCESGGKKHE